MTEVNTSSTMINVLNGEVSAREAAATSESDWEKFGNVLNDSLLGVGLAYVSTSTAATSQLEAGRDAPNTSSSQTSSSNNPRTDVTEDPQRANIIIFGESGSGKSSLVNMIAGTDRAETSDAATGCTFVSTPYEVDLPEHSLRIWDTAGLNEARNGAVDFSTAARNLYELTRNLKNGVHLLVYCVRNRITENTVQNYNMFRAFCDGKVAMVLVIIAMENCKDEDAWWKNNVGAFERVGITVVDHACVSTLRLEGKEEAYEAWRTKVLDMIAQRSLPKPWVMERDSWFRLAVTKLIEVLFDGPSNKSKKLYQALIETGSSKKDAQEAARKYDESFHQGAKKKFSKLRRLLPESKSPASIAECA